MKKVDPGGRSALLGCVMSYSWHAPSRRFHVVPEVTASLGFDTLPSSTRQLVHPQDIEHTGQLETTARVNISSLDDVSRHTCTITFSFSPGKKLID